MKKLFTLIIVAVAANFASAQVSVLPESKEGRIKMLIANESSFSMDSVVSVWSNGQKDTVITYHKSVEKVASFSRPVVGTWTFIKCLAFRKGEAIEPRVIHSLEELNR